MKPSNPLALALYLFLLNDASEKILRIYSSFYIKNRQHVKRIKHLVQLHILKCKIFFKC